MIKSTPSPAAPRDLPCPAFAPAAGCESFYRAERFLSDRMRLDEMLRSILEEGLEAVGATRGLVGLVNRSTGELEIPIVAGRGWEECCERALPIRDEPGAGITPLVAATGIPYITGNVQADPHYRMYFPDVHSEIAVPLVDAEQRTIGVLNFESTEVDAFDQRDLQLLLALSNQASIAHTVTTYRSHLTALIDIGNELSTNTDMGAMLQCLVDRTLSLLGAEDCTVFEIDSHEQRLIVRASSVLLGSLVGEATYRVGEGLTGWIAKHGRAARVANVREDPRWRGLYPERVTEAIESFLGVPIFARSRLWGVLRVARRKPARSLLANDFSERDEQLLTTVARQAGAAVTQHTLIASQLQMERMAAWGEMSARSAHMIGNKVFALKGQLNELEYLVRQQEIPGEQVVAVVERAERSLYRLEELLTEFRDFLTATSLERRPVDLNELVSSVAREDYPDRCCVAIRVETAPGLPPVSADAARLRRAVSELLENAVNHQAEGGEVRLVTGPWGEAERGAYPRLPFRSEWSARGGAVRIEVIDRGPGVPAENKTRLFDPFFTTRAKGMGLGLSIVKGIVDAHQGAIAEVGEEGKGAHFILVLPAAGGPPAEAGTPRRR